MNKPVQLLAPVMSIGLISALLAGQEQPPTGKDKKEPNGGAESIIARVAKDMQTAQDRLKKSDPGDATRKIQRNIVDGLDELIKQNSMAQGGGGTSTKVKTRAQKQSGEFQPGAEMDRGGQQDMQLGPKGAKNGDDKEDFGQAKPGRPDGSAAKDKPKGQGEGEGKDENHKAGGAKNAGKEDEKQSDKGQAKTKEPGNDPSAEGGLASAKPARAKSSIVSELYRNDWGHLPLTKRLEMDAYSKERFMPRYDEALQQYYRSIAEQSQKKDNHP
jgi:hypothetical protein